MLNKVMAIGYLGADPEMRYTGNGTAVTNFRIASTRRYTSNGEQREETEWFRVVAWNRLAETTAEYLKKGALVYVEGRQQTRQWEDQEGNKRYSTELVANEVIFLDRKGEGGGGRQRGLDDDFDSDINPDDLPF